MKPMSTELPPVDAKQILTAISHELRNLMQSISGCNQLIEDALADRQLDRMADYWRIGHQKQEVLSNLVQDVLFLIEDGIPQSAEKTVSEIIRRAILSVTRQTELSNVALVCNQPQPDVASRCYPDILQRCIRNILDFSIRSCPEDGSGQVSVSIDHDVALQSISVEIADNGRKLISNELQLFSNHWWQFDQWDRFLISLAVSRKIANGLGGELMVKNADGSAKSFTLNLIPSTEPKSGAANQILQPHP